MTADEQNERSLMMLSILTSMDASLKKLVAIAEKRKAPAARPGPDEATDEEMDSVYGDPTIRTDPKRWRGESYVGSKFSGTSPEYLDTVASFKDWQADKDDETQALDAKGRLKSTWARKDAKLARGWARRLRAGGKPAQTSTQDVLDDDFGHATDDFG